jgi:hypothetical protein
MANIRPRRTTSDHQCLSNLVNSSLFTLLPSRSTSDCNQLCLAACRCHGKAANFQVERIVYDEGWDLFGYAGWDPRLQAMVVSFRGTDSHSIYNWAENMRYWRTDFKVPFPGSDGSKVHTGAQP